MLYAMQHVFMSDHNVCFREIRRARGLSLRALASAIGVNKTTVLWWERRKVPAERVLDVERITGISRHELRPDLYPMEAAR
jgi:DNA-binding transcriptional regulator YdaS (Cro superfamily)